MYYIADLQEIMKTVEEQKPCKYFTYSKPKISIHATLKTIVLPNVV